MSKNLYTTLFVLMCFGVWGQDIEIKPSVPIILPPSPTVAALMKFEEVPVSNYTGIPDVSIPLFSTPTHSKDISLDISLKYHPAGVAAKERASDVGLGWSLFAGGTISRTVRGIADELLKPNGGPRVGIYHDSIPALKNNYYEILEELLDEYSTAFEEKDEYLWNAQVRGMMDTEHDLWQFNFMGKSGRFYIKKDSLDNLIVTPLDDYRLKIVNHYGVSGNKYKPTGFDVYDERGYKYVFDIVETTRASTFGQSVSPITFIIATDFSYATTFDTAFHLSKVYDNNGNELIDITFNEDVIREVVNDTNDTHNLEDYMVNLGTIREYIIFGHCGDAVINFNPYPMRHTLTNTRSTIVKKIEQIKVAGRAKIDFDYSQGRDDTNIFANDSSYVFKGLVIKDWANNVVKRVKLTQGYSTVKDDRLILEKVTFEDPGETKEEAYTFGYRENVNPYSTPDQITADYWGYFNLRPLYAESLFFREPHHIFGTSDLLQKMTYPTGGCAIFDFEANTYSYEGDTALSDFNANPSNWDEDYAGVNYDNTDVPTSNDVIGLSGIKRDFFSISETQDVYFKCELNTVSGSDNYMVIIKKFTSPSTYTDVGGTIIESGALDYTSRFFVIKNLAPGDYKITVFNQATGSSDFVSGDFYAFYKELNSNNYEFLYGGGNRIRRIGYFKEDVPKNYYQDYVSTPTPDRERHYNYNMFDDASKSSGSLAYSLPQFAYDRIKKECDYCTTGITLLDKTEHQFNYNIETSFNNLNPVKTQGADVGYKNVSVSETGNGYSQYEYTSPITDPEDIGTINLSPPFLPTKNIEYKRGLLKKERIFDESDKLLRETLLDYDFADSVAITGFRTYYPEYDYVDIGVDTDYNNYKLYIESCFQHPLFVECNDYFLTDSEPACDCFCYFGRPRDFIYTAIIEEAYGWAKLTSKTTKEYFYPTSTPVIVETDETFTYNTLNKQMSETTRTNSLGETLKTKYYYHTGNSIDSDNRIAEIEKIETYRNSDLLSTSKIIYSDSFSGNDAFLPQTIQIAKAAQSLEDRLHFTLYDGYGNPLELEQEGGTAVSYIWGYNRTQPIAKIENATNAQIATALGVALNTIDESDMSALNGLRASMPQAMVTTMTHIPLVGVATMTDPKGDVMTFEYDGFNRLETVIDKQGKILSENEYHYTDISDPYNFVQTKTYKVATSSSISTPTAQQAAISKTYFDGLGRPIQQIAHKQAGNGNDLITHIEYDSYGRQPKEYLPYYNSSASLAYDSSPLTGLSGSYAEEPFSEKVFEASPLNRLLKQGAPGTAWQVAGSGPDNTIKFDYQANIDEDVIKYTATATWNSTDKVYDIALVEDDEYEENELYRNITKNENWVTADGDNNTTQEFKDKQGRVVLKRSFGTSDVGGTPTNDKHNTYYVYDQYGNLTYVIPPLADGTVDSGVLDDLCYQYKYDARNRLVEKKLPGKQWEYIVYDKLDRVVATGPTLPPFKDLTPTDLGWMITKYDALGRNVLTAWMEGTFSSGDRDALQDIYTGTTDPLFETRTSSPTTINGVSFEYTNTALPTSDYHVLTVNYFDDYDFPDAPSIPTHVMNDNSQAVGYNNTNQPKGLATGSWVRILENSGTVNADVTYMLYDNKARVVRSHTDNYLTGYTQIDSKIDFEGKTNVTQTAHKRTSSDTEIFTEEVFTYTDQSRLEEHTHTIHGSGIIEVLAANAYDQLGQLITKKVGSYGTTFADGLQEVNYTYNIRGWLNGINNVTGLGTTTPTYPHERDLFAFGIRYNDPDDIPTNYYGTPLYNGNISETYWRSSDDDVLRKYGYEYDELNRLTNAVYMKPDATVKVTNSYNESLSYDKNGNVTHLDRYGDLDTDAFNIQIDELAYSYHPDKKNQLMRVVDATLHPAGLTDDHVGYTPDSTDDYTYDDFGNMLTDQNKQIDSIYYNHLNLPRRIIFAGTNKQINYLYDATGKKVWKAVANGSSVSVTDYLTGFQYEQVNSGDIELKFFPHAEGYVNNVVVDDENVYNYVYNYTDHLGNIRMRYTWDGLNLVILEENHYYPFGLKHEKYNTTTWEFVKPIEVEYPIGVVLGRPSAPPAYQYKYNGKEWQHELGLNMYDYGARNYDPAIGRWVNFDPKAEEYRRWSPYNYCMNSPMQFVDPDGMGVTDWYKNNITGKVTWIEGSKTVEGHTNLGYTWGHTDAKGNRLLMDGDTKQITYNGKVLSDFGNKSKADDNGFAFADGGNNQDPSSLRRGGRKVNWLDAFGTGSVALTLLSYSLNKFSSLKDKGTNGGKPTVDDKVGDIMDATNATAGEVSTVKAEADKTTNTTEKAKEKKDVNNLEDTHDIDSTYNKDGMKIFHYFEKKKQ